MGSFAVSLKGCSMVYLRKGNAKQTCAHLEMLEVSQLFEMRLEVTYFLGGLFLKGDHMYV